MCGNFTPTESLQTSFTKFRKIHIHILLLETDDDDDDIIIAAMCLLLNCTTQVAVTMSQKRQRSTWVRNYLWHRHQDSVYYSLLPDLKVRHREKFRNFLHMEFEAFEELF